MKISGFLEPNQVVFLKGSSKERAIDHLVEVITGKLELISPREVRDAIFKREEIMSTGIGNGLAIPHIRLDGIDKAVIAIGISRDGIHDYESLDDEPVRFIVLIAVPQGAHETYLRLLSIAADVLKQDDLRQRILESKDEEEVYAIFARHGDA